MATTIATISLASSDLTSSSLGFTATNPLYTAGTATGLSLTSGLSRTITEYASSGVIDTTVLYRSDDAATNGANKVYIKNMSTTAAEYYTLYVTGDRATDVHGNADPGLTEIGRLYAGDWAFFPWNNHDGAADIKITPSVSTSITLEYMLLTD